MNDPFLHLLRASSDARSARELSGARNASPGGWAAATSKARQLLRDLLRALMRGVQAHRADVTTFGRETMRQRNLYIHAGVFVLVNLPLLVVNLVTNAQSLWFYWPLLTWSVVLAAHALIVLGTASSFAAQWEECKIRELMGEDVRPDMKREGASRPS